MVKTTGGGYPEGEWLHMFYDKGFNEKGWLSVEADWDIGEGNIQWNDRPEYEGKVSASDFSAKEGVTEIWINTEEATDIGEEEDLDG